MVATNIVPDRAIGIVANGSFTLDPASVAANTAATETAAVPEARVGDFVAASPRVALDAGLILTHAWVATDGTITIELQNVTAAAIDAVSAMWDYVIVRGNIGVPTLG